MPLPTKKISLSKYFNIGEPEAFKQHILSFEGNIKCLEIDGDSFENDHLINELVKCILEQEISFQIGLPNPYRNKFQQRTIDEHIADCRRRKNIQAFAASSEGILIPESMDNPSATPKRTRSYAKPTPKIDIAFQSEQTQTQETEVVLDVAVANDYQQDLSIEENQYFGPSLNKDEFVKRCLAKKDYLFSISEAKNLWQGLFNYYPEKPGERPAKYFRISEAACDKILAHYRQFKFGFDLKYLPESFCIKAKGNDECVLDYDLENTCVSSPLAIQLNLVQALEALAPTLRTPCLSHDKKKAVLSLWEKLYQKADYEREALTLFNQYLPLLSVSSSLNKALLHSLFFKDGVFQKASFEFLHLHFRRIAALFPDATSLGDPDKENAKQTLSEYFPGDRLKQAIDLCNDYVNQLEKSPQDLSKHAIYTILSKDLQEALPSTLSSDLSAWQQTLLLTNAHLNALIQLYQTHGAAGLKKLFNLWEGWNKISIGEAEGEQSLLKLLQKQCFTQFQSYAPLLDPAYAEAVTEIQGFYADPSKGKYWETLLKQHYIAVGEDDLPVLVKAFKTFSEEVSRQGLSFNAVNPELFKNVKSLPVALARILALLKNSRRVDTVKQWECHTQLDYSPSGVPKTLCYQNYFIVPEMGIKTEKNGLMTSVSYSDKLTGMMLYKWEIYPGLAVDKLYALDNARLERSFYRVLARQATALPLDFYQAAYCHLDQPSFSQDLKLALCKLLLCSTAGVGNALFWADPVSTLKKWKDLIERIPDNIKKMIEAMLSPVQREMLALVSVVVPAEWMQSSMRRLAAVFIHASIAYKGLSGIISFPLHFYEPLLENYFATVTGIFDHKQALKKNEEICKQLERITKSIFDSHGHYFLGMRFYENINAQFGEENDIYSMHTKLVEYINEIYRDNSILGYSLISLISTFGLDSIVSIDSICKAIDASDVPLIWFSLCLLIDCLIRNKATLADGSQKTLAPQHLIDYLREVAKKGYAPDRYSLVRKHFEYFCDPDILVALESGQISKKLNVKVKNDFPESADEECVITLLQHVMAIQGATSLETFYSLFIQLYSSFEEKAQLSFLNCLNQLCKSISANGRVPTGSTVYDILRLLAKGHRYNFIYFVQKDQAINPESRNLLARLENYFKIRGEIKEKSTLALFERLLLLSSEETALDPLLKINSHIKVLLAEDSNLSTPLFDFLNALANHYAKDNKSFTAHIESFLNNVMAELKNESQETEAAKEIKISSVLEKLFYHCKESPRQLEGWLGTIQEKIKEETDKLYLLHILSISLSQNTLDKEAFNALIEKFQANPSLVEQVKACYQSPPYPSIKSVLQWCEENRPNSGDGFNQRYEAFMREPCGREESNGFKLEYAKKQAKSFEKVVFFDSDLEQLNEAVHTAKPQLPSELLATLESIKNKTNGNGLADADLLTLVAVLAEVLYRSQSKSGNSFEINTTQYLAIVAMLKTKGHVTSEIATGEGKSRIMAILAASQFILGKTTDFVTSNVALAQRDYMEFAPFFTMLGVKTQLIAADTPFENYQSHAIHYTDMVSLSLFRNRALAQQKFEKVFDNDEGKRSLLLDEADSGYFDLAQTRFNYSTDTCEGFGGMKWVYPLLIEFILLPDPKNLYYKDMNAHTQKFMLFAKDKLSGQKYSRLTSLSHNQIETWLESAKEATGLKFNRDFIIEPDTSISPPEGMCIASTSYVLHKNRVCKASKYSSGVQQCLHAYLEKQRLENNSPDKALKKVLSRCTKPFHIDLENHIITSSNSYDFLQPYRNGSILGVTGTSGTTLEKDEAPTLYKKGNSQMRFIVVPRHRSLKRVDKPCHLAANAKRQARILMNYIETAYVDQQPVLLIMKDDIQREALQTIIQDLNAKRSKKRKIPEEKFQALKGDASCEQEKAVVEQAGQAGMITFATDRLGRGTDIKLDVEAKKTGLLVLLGYLPDERDYYQILGRSGRQSQPGETRVVINASEIDAEFYLNNASWQQKKWAEQTWNAQLQRLTEFLLGNVYASIQNKFTFDDELMDRWPGFLKDIESDCKTTREAITKLFRSSHTTGEDLEHELQTYLTRCHEKFYSHYGEAFKDAEHKEIRSINKLFFDLINREKESAKKSLVIYTEYDPATDGRATVYNKMFVEIWATLLGKRRVFANTRAALRGEGILFADTRSLLAGERLIFANTRNAIYHSFFKPTSVSEYSESPQAVDSVKQMARELSPAAG